MTYTSGHRYAWSCIMYGRFAIVALICRLFPTAMSRCRSRRWASILWPRCNRTFGTRNGVIESVIRSARIVQFYYHNQWSEATLLYYYTVTLFQRCARLPLAVRSCYALNEQLQPCYLIGWLVRHRPTDQPEYSLYPLTAEICNPTLLAFLNTGLVG